MKTLLVMRRPTTMYSALQNSWPFFFFFYMHPLCGYLVCLFLPPRWKMLRAIFYWKHAKLSKIGTQFHCLSEGHITPRNGISFLRICAHAHRTTISRTMVTMSFLLPVIEFNRPKSGKFRTTVRRYWRKHKHRASKSQASSLTAQTQNREHYTSATG